MKNLRKCLNIIIILFVVLLLFITCKQDVEEEEIQIPATPTGVTAFVTSLNDIIIIWSPVSGATGYRVYRSTSVSGTFSRVGDVSTTSFSNTGLNADAMYFYRVSAYNSDGESTQSSSVSARTNPSIPTIPTGVYALASSSTITIKWSEVSGATGYRVFRSTSASGTFSRVGDVSITSFTDIRLSTNTTFYYRVSAYNNFGESIQSSSVSERTLQNNVTQAIPVSSSCIVYEWPWDPDGDFVMTIGNLVFTAATLGGLEILTGASEEVEYVIERRRSNGTWEEIRNIPWASSTLLDWAKYWLGNGNKPGSAGIDHYIVDTGLLSNTQYEYRTYGVIKLQVLWGLIPPFEISKIGPYYQASALTHP